MLIHRQRVYIRRNGAAARRPISPATRPAVDRLSSPAAGLLLSNATPIPSHYLDYSRSLTPQGGVLIIYKDIDTRWRWWVWRFFAWSSATAFDAWLAFDQSPLESSWLNTLCWLVATGLNLFIVWRAIEIRRQIEIRPDCLILEGTEVFWRRHLEGGWPELRPKDETTFILGGIYGTRFVEFGTLRRFDEFDRMPETFAAHVQQAIEQLWIIP